MTVRSASQFPPKSGIRTSTPHTRRGAPHGFNSSGKDARATVRQIVTVDGRDNGVLDVHSMDGLSHAQWFKGIDNAARVACLDGAVAASRGYTCHRGS